MNAHLATARALAAPPMPSSNRIASRTMTELAVLYEAYERLDETVWAFLDQPRCRGQALEELNKVSLEASQRRFEILDEIRASNPTDETDILSRAGILARHWFDSGGDDPAELKDIMASLEGVQ